MQVSTNLNRSAAVTGIAIILSGCETLSWKGEKTEDAPITQEAPKPAMKIPVGTVHHVDAEGNFVLIRSSRMLQIEPGTMITVFDDQGEIAATLVVSPARKGSFLTADIKSGIPKIGQQTAMDHLPAKQAAELKVDGANASAESEIQVLE